MKQTKENVVKVLKAMHDNAAKLADLAGSEEEKNSYIDKCIAYDEAIWLLTDKAYFDEICSIFMN